MSKTSSRITLTCDLDHGWNRDAKRATSPCPFCTDRELLRGFNDLLTKRPKVALDWSPDNTLSPSDVSWKSAKYFKWLCHDCGHEWNNCVRNIAFLGSRCPSCADREKHPDTGFHIYHDRIAKMWDEDSNGYFPVYIPRSSNQEFSFICPTYGHPFSRSIKSLLKTDFRCAVCDGGVVLYGFNDVLTLHPELSLSWSSKNSEFLDPLVLKDGTKYFWTCLKGHESYKTIRKKINKPGCEVCLNRRVVPETSLRNTHPEFKELWSDQNSKNINSVSSGSGYRALWKCKEYGHVWSRTVARMISENSKCPICAGDKLLRGFNDAATLWPELKSLWSDKNSHDYSHLSIVHKNSSRKFYWVCENKHTTFTSCKQRAIFNCKSCTRSKGEIDLQKSLENLGIRVIESDRSLISPFELDLVLPDYKVAVEYNGDYWHGSNRNASKGNFDSIEDYHQMKLNSAFISGYRLLFVWESQWKESKGKVLELILKSLNGDPQSELLQLVSPTEFI